ASRVPDPRTFSWNRKFADEDDRDHHEPSPRHGRQGADEDDHPEPRTGLQTTGTRAAPAVPRTEAADAGAAGTRACSCDPCSSSARRRQAKKTAARHLVQRDGAKPPSAAVHQLQHGHGTGACCPGRELQP
ncbi:hypothetical protein ACJX0J_028805, partial [Zea mays]